MTKQPGIPIDVLHLLPVLDLQLIDLLKSLKPEEWEKKTIAKLWTVKNVVAHLLDGNIRAISMFRDNYYAEHPNSNSHEELVNFLNRLNADWVQAMKRVSPQMLIFLHETTGQVFCNFFKSLHPFDKSALPVDWAGEAESKNWMEIARQYTEKWLHQQQIRDAVNKPGLMTRELYYPFIDIFMLALPLTYRAIVADEGTIIKVTITTAIGGSWFLQRTNNEWLLMQNCTSAPTTEIELDPDTSWKLFSKSLRPAQVKDQVRIYGNESLGQTALQMVSVMA